MLKSCKYCGGIHERGYVCPAKPERKPAKQKIDYSKYRRNSAADMFRGSKLWKLKRDSIKERDLQCCRVCFEKGIINSQQLSVHHIEPLGEKYSLRLEDDNLITLCGGHNRCHELAEQGKIPRPYLHALAQSPPRPEDLIKKLIPPKTP